MKNIFFVIIALSFLFIFTFATVGATQHDSTTETISIPASKDNTLYEDDSGALSNGAGAYFFAGETANQKARRGVIAFEIPGAIPPNAIIVRAELKLHMSKSISGPQSISLHRVLSDWGEGDSDASGQEGRGIAATAGDATWLHTFCCDALWSEPGGDFFTTPSASTMIAGIGDYAWDGEGLAGDVQIWLTHPDENNGWILVGNEAVGTTAKRFDSRQNPSLQNRPELVIEYAMPSSWIFLPVMLSGPASP